VLTWTWFFLARMYTKDVIGHALLPLLPMRLTAAQLAEAGGSVRARPPWGPPARPG